MILNTYNINIEMLEKEIGYVYKDKNLLLPECVTQNKTRNQDNARVPNEKIKTY